MACFILICSANYSKANSQQALSSLIPPENVSTVQVSQPKAKKLGSIHRYTLANGLKIVFLADKTYPYFCFSTWYKVGSKDDPQQRTGLTHLVEHLLFQNVGNFQGDRLINLIVRSGGEFSGFTSEDFTTQYINLPSSQLELAVQGLSGCMRSAHFGKADVQKEIAELAKECQLDDQDPALRLNKEVHALAYEQHPYHNPPSGWFNDLEHLTYEQARVHYDRFFQPNNACLILAGGFDEEVATKLIEKYFAPLPKLANLKLSVYPAERPQLAERQIKLKSLDNKETVMLAYKVPGVSDSNAPALTILEQLLNTQPHGLLRNKLIETGLCTDTQAYFELKHDPGLFIIKCSGVAPHSSSKVVQVLDHLLNGLKEEQLSDSEVNQVLKQAELAYYNEGNGPYAAVFQTGFFESVASAEQTDIWPQRFRQVTAAQILETVKNYFNEENRILSEILVETPPVNKLKTGQIDHKFSDMATVDNGMHMRLAAYQDNINNYRQVSISTPNSAAKKSDAQIVTGQINHRVLDNGLDVIVIESHLKPIVSIYGTVNAGSIFDSPDCHGQARLMTAILNTPENTSMFNCRMQYINFSSRCLSNDLDQYLKNLFFTLQQPKLQNPYFDNKKNDLINKLKFAQINSEERVRRALFNSFISDNSPYHSLHPEQEIASISALKLSDLQDFYQKYINPGSTSIVVAGDVNAKEVFALLENVSRNWSGKTTTTNEYPSLTLSNRQAYKASIIIPKDSQSQVVLGRIIPITDIKQAKATWVALNIADCILSSNPIFSRLAEEFEAKPELAIETDDRTRITNISKLGDNLIWSMRIKLKPGVSTASCIQVIQKELEEFAQTGISSEDLAEARRYLLGNISIRECFNLNKLAHFVLQSHSELNDFDLLTKTKKIMMTLSTNDMNQFISNLFKPQNANLIVAGPRQLTKQIHPIHPATEAD